MTEPQTPINYEALFNDSYRRIQNARFGNRGFFDAFYDHFLDKSDAIREKFSGSDMVRQKEMLEKSLLYLMDFFSIRSSTDYMERIAERHGSSDLDIPPEFYDLWLESIIEILRVYDPESNDETELAWRVILSPGITFMKYRYNHPQRET